MISVGITPFANDTFGFAALAKRAINSYHNYSISYHDLEELNQRSLRKIGNINKISFNTLGKVLSNYVLLPVGSCLGFQNGPKIVAREKFDLKKLSGKKIGIPGTNTTAYMLLKILAPHAASELIFPYHELTQKVTDGTIDCALTIHETRFQIDELGLYEIGDIFDLWTAKTDSPLPLGGIVVERNLGEKTIAQICTDIQGSFSAARNDKKMALDFALGHSFKKDPDFVEKNVNLYVNDETYNLSQIGIKSIQSLLDLGHKAGFFPETTSNWLF